MNQVDFNKELSDAERQIQNSVASLRHRAMALETVGLDKLAEDLSWMANDIEMTISGLSKAYNRHLTADLRAVQMDIGNTLSALLDASDRKAAV